MYGIVCDAVKINCALDTYINLGIVLSRENDGKIGNVQFVHSVSSHSNTLFSFVLDGQEIKNHFGG